MKSNKGYSLVELLVSIAAFSIIMVAIVSIMSSTMNTYKQATLDVELQEEAQVAANIIEEMICDATDISGGSGTYSFKVGSENHALKYNATKKAITIDDEVICKDVAAFSIDNWQGSSTFVTTEAVLDEDGNPTGETKDFNNAAFNQAKVNIDLENKETSYSLSRDVYFRNEVEENDFHSIENLGGSSEIIVVDPSSKSYALNRYDYVNMSDLFQIRYGAILQVQEGSAWKKTDGSNIFVLESEDISSSYSKNSDTFTYYLTTGDSGNSDHVNPTSGKIYRLSGYANKASYDADPKHGDDDTRDNAVNVILSIPKVGLSTGDYNVVNYHSTGTCNGEGLNACVIPIEGINPNNAIKAGVTITSTCKIGGTTSGSKTLSHQSGIVEYSSNAYSGLPGGAQLGIAPDPYSNSFVVMSGNPANTANDNANVTFSFNIGGKTYSTNMKYNVLSTTY